MCGTAVCSSTLGHNANYHSYPNDYSRDKKILIEIFDRFKRFIDAILSRDESLPDVDWPLSDESVSAPLSPPILEEGNSLKIMHNQIDRVYDISNNQYFEYDKQ